MAQILLWLRRGKRGEAPFADDEEDESLWGGCYAGGRTRKKTGQVVAVQGLLCQPRPFDGRVAARVEEWLKERQGSERAGLWAKWKAWARQGLPSEYLNRKEDVVDNENKALGFIGYLG